MGLANNTVVWASAGTGKTRKLVDVYLELLEQGIDPMRIVAVTFTEKAAAEMRDRIRSALYSRPGHWMKTIAVLPNAPISTIHGFCGMLLREHAFELQLDPSFTILDEQRSLDFARESARDTIREEIRSGNEETEQLFGDFGLDNLVETIVSAGYWLNSLGVGDAWLDARIEAQRAAAAPIETTLSGEIKKYGSDFQQIGELADEMEAKKAKHPLRKRDEPSALLPKIGQIAGVAAAERLSRVVKMSAERFRARKRAANTLDFDDLLLGVRDLLKHHPTIRRHYQNHFQVLLVDEFQDTDEVQAEIISLLAEDPDEPSRFARGKLMIVGDPKQSIYRFRRARVTVFFRLLDKILEEGGTLEHLQDNYRSAAPIAHFSNLLCEVMMDGRGKGAVGAAPSSPTMSYRVRFSERDALRPKSEAPFLGITYVAAEPSAKAAQGREMEAEAIARLLKEWKSSGHIQSWKEVAVLLRAMSNVEIYLGALEQHGIPVYVVEGTAFYQKSEVSDLIAFLELVLHPADELLRAIVSTSPLFGLTFGELWQQKEQRQTSGVPRVPSVPLLEGDGAARSARGGASTSHVSAGLAAPKRSGRRDPLPASGGAVPLCEGDTGDSGNLHEILQHWVERRDSATAAEILQDVIRETDFDAVLMAQKNGQQRIANVGKLIEITRGLARQGTTALDDVVRHLRDRATDTTIREPEAQIVSQMDDVVRVLTVHQAKGLEFDIVIIPDLAARTARGASERVFFSDQWGLLVGASYGLHRKPLPHSLILEEKVKEDDQQYEEEKRLLYVAITRARTMLVLGEGFSKQAGPWLQWMEQLFDGVQPGAIEKAREGKTQTVRFKGSVVKVLPASQLNIPEQLTFTTSAILVGEPVIPRIPPPRIEHSLEMTPSDLGSLNGCFRFFHWTRISGIAEPGSAPTGETPQMRLGSLAHKVLERAEPVSTDILVASGLTDLEKVFATEEWRTLNASSPEREMPFIMNLSIRGKECWVRGRMDAAVCFVDSSAAEVPRVVDYKYATWFEGDEADYEIQMTAYALALMKALGTDRAVAELWYLKTPMKVIRRDYTFVEAEERLSELLSKYVDAVTTDEWPMAERSYCDRVKCGFRGRCWGAN